MDIQQTSTSQFRGLVAYRTEFSLNYPCESLSFDFCTFSCRSHCPRPLVYFRYIFFNKLALAAIKAYREKTERSLKAEREEVVRVRKLCGVIARMVRDWWRQIDKVGSFLI